jgi:type IX secretion system PorP/SprF family membrane protein
MKNIISICILFIALNTLCAQDIHFSQYYNMPLLLNPSLTGHIEGTYRIKAIYRTQWGSIASGGVYATPGISLDMNYRKGESLNSFGGGLVLFTDRTGASSAPHLKTYSILASAAYHMSLDKKERNYLSFGLQAGILNKRLNLENITFYDQFQPDGSLGQSEETLASTDVSNTDLNAGVTFSSYFSEKSNIKIGLAAMHLLGAKESLLGNNNYKLPARFALHGQGQFAIGDKFELLPNLLFMAQAGASQFNIGTNLLYSVSPDLGAMLGAAFRTGDAGIALIGFRYKGVDIAFSYDLNTSDLANAASGNSSMEISLGYVGRIVKADKPIYPAVRFF